MPNPPLRLQRRRTKGWRAPPGTVCCTRPGILGNPFPVEIFGRDEAVRLHRAWLKTGLPALVILADGSASGLCYQRQMVLAKLPALRNHHLACWCALCPAHRDGKPFGVRCHACAPCHVDCLLEVANA